LTAVSQLPSCCPCKQTLPQSPSSSSFRQNEVLHRNGHACGPWPYWKRGCGQRKYEYALPHEFDFVTDCCVEVEVQGCIWQATKPDKAYTVRFTGGSGSDACIKRKGGSPTMSVSEVGITCASLGDVEVDDDGWCFYQQSRWGMSYTVDGKPYSGSTSSRIVTGPVHSDIELREASPGTNVCGSKAQCSSQALEWRNSGNEPIYVGHDQFEIDVVHVSANYSSCRLSSSLEPWRR
jgi:hypothetical protein